MEKYDVIYADPPWSFNDKMGKPGAAYAHSLSDQYPTMHIDDIKALDVKSITNKDAWCFLWVTSGNLQEGLDVMKAWGFKYKTVAFVWMKKSVTGKQLYLMSKSSTMAACELCLVGKRGKPKKFSNVVKQDINAPRGKHSAKPLETYDRIEQLVGPDAKKIELFARVTKEGWNCLGNAIDGKDIRQILGVTSGN
jgi:N6-adenosine-specific RNA methylase IME4